MSYLSAMPRAWVAFTFLLVLGSCVSGGYAYHDGRRCYRTQRSTTNEYQCWDFTTRKYVPIRNPNGRKQPRSPDRKLNDYWIGKTVLDMEMDPFLSIRMSKRELLSDGETTRWIFLFPVKGAECATSETARSRWARALTTFSNNVNNQVTCTEIGDRTSCALPNQTPVPPSQLETTCVPGSIRYVTFLLRNDRVLKVSSFEE